MTRLHLFLASAALACSAAASAETPAASLAAATSQPVRSDAIALRTLSALSSQESKPGDRFELEVTKDMITANGLFIAAGSRAWGEVTEVRKKGTWGKPGKIEARILSVRAGDRDIALAGDISAKGRSRKKQVIRASILIAPVVGFWMRGGEAVLPSRTEIAGYLPGGSVTMARNEPAEAEPAPAPARATLASSASR